MEILVCVKRVPTVGGKIAVTPDGQEVDTRMSGFSISPHEECAVEEAVQITERVGGTVSVLTLGPEAAIEQLRGALALGAGRAVLLETDGREFGPIATAAAIAAEVRAHGYDLVLLGNEAADTGDYQVGIRLAHELGWPVATGIKNLSTSAGRRRGPPGVPRRGGGVRAAAARGDHRQGRHQPAALPVAARTPAGQARGGRALLAGLGGRRIAQGSAPGARVEQAPGHRARYTARTRCRNWSASWTNWGSSRDRLCLTELDGADPADASLRALTLAGPQP